MDNFGYEHAKGREIGFLYYRKIFLFVWKSGKVDEQYNCLYAEYSDYRRWQN